MEQEVVISEVTKGICERLVYYKECTKSGMVIGDTKIIEGIDLVIKLIREINPMTVEEEIEEKLSFLIDNYRKLKENRMKVINKYMEYGIENACYIVSLFIREENRKNGKVLILERN